MYNTTRLDLPTRTITNQRPGQRVRQILGAKLLMLQFMAMSPKRWHLSRDPSRYFNSILRRIIIGYVGLSYMSR